MTLLVALALATAVKLRPVLASRGYFRKETINRAYRDDYLARKHGIGRLRRTVGRRRRLSVCDQQERFNYDNEYCCEFCQRWPIPHVANLYARISMICQNIFKIMDSA